MTEQQRGGKGNFANDPKRASEAGKKGGQQSGNNVKNEPKSDPKKASEAGQKDGQNSRRS